MKNKKKIYIKVLHITILLGIVFAITLLHKQNVLAAPTDETPVVTDTNTGIHFSLDNDSGQLSGNLKILFYLTIISLAPSILIMMTSFTRIIVVLHFFRTAIGTQTAPPNQVITGLALFLTMFIMTPVFTKINDEAIKPLDENKITQEQAIEAGLVPLREFMFGQMEKKDLRLLCDIAKIPDEERTTELIPMSVVIPSFVISELRKAFIMGFVVYLPFIVIDMVVASILMSMGMMMLPPATISMPFKILLFIMADGWGLLIGNLVETFY